MTPQPERPRRKHRFWRICRIYFRRVRITAWLIILLLVGVLLYLNQIGLPGFVKTPLLQKLRAHGLDLQFSRLRWRWYQGIVAENVRFGRVNDPFSPQLTLAEVQLLINYKALSRLKLQVDNLALRKGRLVWPVGDTNTPARDLAVDNIHTYLRFLPDDQWSLDNFRAEFAGAKIQLSGIVTNASSVREWEFFHGKRTEPAAAGQWRGRLARLANALDRIHFSTPPDLWLDLRGDARDLQSFAVRVVVAAPGAATPWGNVSQGLFTARVVPGATNQPSHAELSLEAVDAQTPWTAVTNFQLAIQLRSRPSETNLIDGELKLSAQAASTEWVRATNAVFSAKWVHAITNPVPLAGTGRLACDQALTRWGNAQHLEFLADLMQPPVASITSDSSWDWWTNLQPYALGWRLHIQDFDSPKLTTHQIACGGTWLAPLLTVTNFDLLLYDGRFSATAALDVGTRALQLNFKSNFDPHKLSALLPDNARRWLDEFSWEEKPRITGEANCILPAWTNRQPDWRADVQPTLAAAGEFALEGGAYRQVRVVSVHSHFIYSNLCLHLPDLALIRPEGRILASHTADERSTNYYWRIDSTVDLHIFRHLLDPAAQKGVDLLSFTNPPAVACEIWGASHDPERTGFKGRVALTNFSFRGQSLSAVHAGFQYTNKLLQFFQPWVQRDDKEANADGLLADFNARRVYLTNGFTTMEPMVIASTIGPQIARAIEPYQFLQPPVGRVHGAIPMEGEEGADLHFDLDGGPFSWWKLHLDRIAGHVHWAGLHLSLSNVVADCYGGKAWGAADFDFPRRTNTTQFKFHVAATNFFFHALMNDLSSRTNQLEGRLNANIDITQANTESTTSVFGFGDLDLRDGLIWDIPLFGVLSPVLNGVYPGLGNSRATAATSSFIITNGVIFSDDLEIRSAAMRMQYRGAVDFDGRLRARVEAELLRDVWLVGPLVSTVLWPITKMFEYKLTGTLAEPKTEPVYIIPKIVLIPFHPFRTLKGLLPQEPSARTNAPPAFRELQQN